MRRFVVSAIVLGALALLVPASAQAAFPGANGRIAFTSTPESGGTSVFTVNPDGTGFTEVTNDARARCPRWSPDGRKIVFEAQASAPDTSQIYVVNADGSQRVKLSDGTSSDMCPGWSPDGDKIVFERQQPGSSEVDLYVMNADGTGRTRITTTAGLDANPAWSPDGRRIAYSCTGRICTMNADGTGITPLTSSTSDFWPSWSPDGTRLAFARFAIGPPLDPCTGPTRYENVYTMNADGTNPTNLTGITAYDRATAPAWSPDGLQIAFQYIAPETCDDPVRSEILRMNADGTQRGAVTSWVDGNDHQPDWQPVVPGYPRPKGATPVLASLVPAYVACASPNSVHGAPLASQSCNPPQQESAVLTVGSPDANGEPAKSNASVRLDVIAGDPATAADEADIAIAVKVTDVRCLQSNAACPDGALSDYTGRLLFTQSRLRITDRSNAPGVTGTRADIPFRVPLECTGTDDTTVGSTCNLTTSADAALPGSILEGKRAIWELGQIHVRDAGPNGTGYGAGCPPSCGDGDETLFLREGIFVP